MKNSRNVARSSVVALVVEDNDRIRSAEADVLRSGGFDTLSATNAEEALQLLTAHHVDLLITDIRLPGRFDGVALARAAKQKCSNIKVMIVGADVDQFLPDDFHDIADDMLQKPFRLGELERRAGSLAGSPPISE